MNIIPVNPHQSAPETIPEHWREFAEMAREYQKKGKSDNTKRCYRSDFKQFTEWCVLHGIVALPSSPEAVSWYISSLATSGKKPSTLERKLAAIRYAHKAANLASPTDSEAVKEALNGIKRMKGTIAKPKAAALVHHVEAMIAVCPDTLHGKRDRALLSLTLAGAFRGSEPLSLDIGDIERVPEGLRVTLRHSKTDQLGKGLSKGIANGQHIKCADYLREWIMVMQENGFTSGALFRQINKGGKIVSTIKITRGANKGAIVDARLGYMAFLDLVKKYALMAGLDPQLFGTHSMRRGFVTEAFKHNADAADTMAVTKHKKYESVIGYREESDLFRKNPGKMFL